MSETVAMQFKPGTVFEVKSNPADERCPTGIMIGARGVMQRLGESNRIYARWVNSDGTSTAASIDTRHLTVYLLPQAPPKSGSGQGDLRAVLSDLFWAIHAHYGNPRSDMSAAKVLELGRAWKGSGQILLEMIAWLDQSPELHEFVNKLGLKWSTTIDQPSDVQKTSAV